MTFGYSPATTAAACLLGALVLRVSATPLVALPFNSQVPTVARAGQPYVFQLSTSTFAPEGAEFTYSLSNPPAWLTIDSASRTLSGTPGQGDVGASTFILTATDDTGVAQVSCTLVISADPAPQLEGDISKQLAVSANLSSTEPPVVTVLPSNDFHFSFEQSSFIDIVQRKLYYYATLTDHTPLPSWLKFDAPNMAFSGTAPLLSAFPQSWEVELIASDVVGFAGATASFTIAIGIQQLVFVPSEQSVSITNSTALSLTTLQNQLFRNGQSVSPQSLAHVETSPLPHWMSFDSGNLAITGNVPAAVSDLSVTVTVTDTLGDVATATINFVSGDTSLISGTIGSLTAYSGQTFEYEFPSSLFTKPDPVLSVTVPTTAMWLQFDSTTRELHGTPPSESSPSTITATLVAKPSVGATGQALAFTIDIKAATNVPSSSTSLATNPSATGDSSSTPLAAPAGAHSRSHLSGGVIAAIVIVSLMMAVLLIAGLLLCIRRRKRKGYERQAKSPLKQTISRPVPVPDVNAIYVSTTVERDVEKANEGDMDYSQPAQTDSAPQIALNLPHHSHTNSRKSKWLKRFSLQSQASSLGNGEDAIKADSNIPEWGTESQALQTPHDSFSVPTEIARVSRQLSQSSPTKRATKRLRDRRQSRQSIGLGIDTVDSSLTPRHSSRQSRGHRRGGSSLVPSTAIARSSQATLSTRGTSVLSAKASDFPRPPTRSTCTMSRSIPTLSFTEADKQNSIRLVTRSDSAADSRSMVDKRQSFIRNRASTSIQSPLFAHGSRAPSIGAQNGHTSIAESSAGSARRPKRIKSTLTSYSESSSIEPYSRSRDPCRFSARVRSVFAPNFPRAITRSSMGADDEGAEEDSSSSWTTSSSSDEIDLAAEMVLPRHKRGWVLPGEASPTPPPAPPGSRQTSDGRYGMTPDDSEGARSRWRGRVKDCSSSPLSAAVMMPGVGKNSDAYKSQARRMSKLSEPIDLVSNDSVNRTRPERPRLAHTNSNRPVSVEEVQRLSSLRADTGTEAETQAGSEMWEDTEHDTTDLEGNGLMPKALSGSKQSTQRSNMSGPAFL